MICGIFIAFERIEGSILSSGLSDSRLASFLTEVYYVLEKCMRSQSGRRILIKRQRSSQSELIQCAHDANVVNS